MTAYLRDMTGTSKGKIKRVIVCSYCKHGTHIIDTTLHPNDFLAKKDNDGKLRCGDCIENDIQNMIKASKKSVHMMQTLLVFFICIFYHFFLFFGWARLK